jgi:SAM-dependent methyltransferase
MSIKQIDVLLNEKSGIMLDIGCGANKQNGFVGIDVRDLPEVDIVWDVLKFPWPLGNESVVQAMCSHLVEHIPPFGPDPKLLDLIRLLLDKRIISEDEIKEYLGDIRYKPAFVAFMDEVWRVLKPSGTFAIACPHGFSSGFLQDPTHCNEVSEATWAYFDPYENKTNGLLWSIYQPKPWAIDFIHWSPEANIEVILKKRTIDSTTSEIVYE